MLFHYIDRGKEWGFFLLFYHSVNYDLLSFYGQLFIILCHFTISVLKGRKTHDSDFLWALANLKSQGRAV